VTSLLQIAQAQHGGSVAGGSFNREFGKRSDD